MTGPLLAVDGHPPVPVEAVDPVAGDRDIVRGGVREPAPGWSHTDPAGHVHRFANKQLPTLTRTVEHRGCDGTLCAGWITAPCEGYEVEVWRCGECAAPVDPQWRRAEAEFEVQTTSNYWALTLAVEGRPPAWVPGHTDVGRGTIRIVPLAPGSDSRIRARLQRRDSDVEPGRAVVTDEHITVTAGEPPVWRATVRFYPDNPALLDATIALNEARAAARTSFPPALLAGVSVGTLNGDRLTYPSTSFDYPDPLGDA